MEDGFAEAYALRRGLRNRSRLRTGGALLACGAGAWIVHCVMGIVVFVAVLTMSSKIPSDPNAMAARLAAIALAVVVSIIADVLAAFLLSAGLLVYQAGLRVLAWTDPSGEEHSVRRSTQSRAGLSALFAVVFGALGVTSFGTLALGAGIVDSLAATSVLARVLVLWIIASFVLIAAAAALSSFLKRLALEAEDLEPGGGSGFLTYAVVNAIAALLLTGPMLSAYLGPAGAARGLAGIVIVGGVMEFVVVPFIGAIAFSLLIGKALDLRRVRPGTALLGLGSPGTLPPAPVHPSPPGTCPSPPSEMIPAADTAQTTKARIEDLERALEEHKAALSMAEESLADGRLSTAQYDAIVRNRKERVAELEGKVRALEGMRPPKAASSPDN